LSVVLADYGDGASPKNSGGGETTLIVGTSVGGVRTAQALRSKGYKGRIILVGEESSKPYDKPPLSKGLLTGEARDSSLWLMREGEIESSGFEVLLGERAEELKPFEHLVRLASGKTLHYDVLVVATGARARPSPWQPEGGGIHLLRTMEDSLALRKDLEKANRVVIVGAGFIGAEVASSARKLGVEVTLIDPLPLPMARIVGEEPAKTFAALHARNGVDVRFGIGVESIEGGPGRFIVHLDDGGVVTAEAVVVGIGTKLNDSWLRSSGLALENGVICDEYCRALGVKDVYAVGDIARWFHHRHDRRVRVEHWTNAVEQGACVAHNICFPEEPRPYEPVEYVWTDQYDWKIQIAGRPEDGESMIAIGEPGVATRFAFLYEGREDQLVGAVAVNWPRALSECRRMLGVKARFSQATERVNQLQVQS